MDKICSVQLCLGFLTVFSIMLLIPSAHGKPLALQGYIRDRLDKAGSSWSLQHNRVSVHMAVDYGDCPGRTTLTKTCYKKEQPQSSSARAEENQGFPERGNTNHQDVLLTLLLNKNLGWRQPADSNLELAKKFEELEQLAKLKEQLLAGEGSEEAYAEAGLLPSHPDKRACFWKYCV